MVVVEDMVEQGEGGIQGKFQIFYRYDLGDYLFI